MHKQNAAAMYYDAKPSMIDSDNLFESKAGGGGGAAAGGSAGSHEPTKYDFERAKLKFDRSSQLAGGGAAGKSGGSKGAAGKSSASSSSKRNSGDCSLLLEKKSYNEAVQMQMYDENMKRGTNKESANYMKTSMNLDGLKVSDDEVSKGPVQECIPLV